MQLTNEELAQTSSEDRERLGILEGQIADVSDRWLGQRLFSQGIKRGFASLITLFPSCHCFAFYKD